MEKKSINNLGIKVSWMPSTARLALKRVCDALKMILK